MPERPEPLDVEHASLGVEYGSDRSQTTRTVTVGDHTVVHTRPRVARDGAKGDGFVAWWASSIRGPKPRPAREAEPLRFMDLFSSVGGLSVGAMEAISSVGLRPMPMLAADVDPAALKVYDANIQPRYTASKSVAGMVDFQVVGRGDGARFAYAPEVAEERLGSMNGEVDLLLAGPPCQGHSSLNNHSRHDDPKNLLYLTVPAVAIAMGVKHIVIENVPNVVADKQGVVRTTIGLLRNAGYNIESAVLRADLLGWPQARKRFFLVASRDTKPIKFSYLTDMFKRDALPVTWLLDDLAKKPLNDRDPMFSVPLLSDENRMRVNWLFDNDEHNLPNIIRPECHKNGTTYPATYGRMWADKPAPTITGGFLTPGRGRFIHPTQPRVLTPREAARVQGFPDWFNFAPSTAEPPSRTQLGTWIGNAVPSLLGYVATLAAVGGEVKATEGLADEVREHAS